MIGNPGWLLGLLLLISHSVSALPTASIRVVGGGATSFGQWPFMAALHWSTTPLGRNSLLCGATLIQPGWLLTAAHCLYDAVGPIAVEQLQAHVGASSLRSLDASDGRAIVDYWIHPGYRARSLAHDVALVKLSVDVYQPLPALADEPLMQSLAMLTPVVVLGWGDTLPGADDLLLPSRLQQAELQFYDSRDCRLLYGMDEVSEHMICALGQGADACEGDSGGPLLVNARGSWVQLGIVSWGRKADPPCANQYPGVYTRIASYRDWMDDVMAGRVEQRLPDDAFLVTGGSGSLGGVLLMLLVWQLRRRRL